MKAIKRIYLVGAGAVGSSYASRLYDMDPACIKVIAGKERIEKYSRNGITINDKPYFFDYIQPDEDAVTADLILVAVKQHHLDQAIKDMKKFVGKDTIIISILNGITSEEIIGREFGTDNILYSFCVGIDAVREGSSIRFSKIGKIVFGEKSNDTHSSKVTAVKELFEMAKIPYSIPVDMIRELWWKFMLNVGVNQASAVLRAPYGVFQNIGEARELMIMAFLEVVHLAERLGINLTRDDIDECIRILGTLSPHGKTSMLQDVEAGRKTEVEIFAGTVVELGQKLGVATPVNDILFKMIRTLEQM